jgi:hypothetical protein
MRRREFITVVGGAAVSWPLAARAQQPDRMRRVGILMALDENDPEAKAYLSGLTQRLAELGWTDGRNLRLDVRWALKFCGHDAACNYRDVNSWHARECPLTFSPV